MTRTQFLIEYVCRNAIKDIPETYPIAYKKGVKAYEKRKAKEIVYHFDCVYTSKGKEYLISEMYNDYY